MSKEVIIELVKSLSGAAILVLSKSKVSNQSVRSLSKIIRIDNPSDLTTEDMCNLSDNSDGLLAYRGSSVDRDNGLAICPGKGGLIKSYYEWSGQFPFGGVNRRDGTTTLWVNSTGIVKPIFLSEPQKRNVHFKTSQIGESDTFVAEGMAPVVMTDKHIWVWSGDTYKEDLGTEEVLLFRVPSVSTPTQLLELSKHYPFLTVGLREGGKYYLRARNPAAKSENDVHFECDSTCLLEVRLQNVAGVREVKSLVRIDTQNINFMSYLDIEGEVLEVVKSI